MKNWIAALLLGTAAIPAQAGDLSQLVEERVLSQVGHQLPVAAKVDVRILNSDRTDALLISDFWYDPASAQYLANITTEEGEVERIAGLALITIPTPVPVRRMSAGEIISEADLQVVDLPHSQVAAFALLDDEKLLGMEVSRVLAQGRPVMEQSVRPPLIIDRGDKVEIRYRNGPMSLSAPGKALNDASKDEELRVVNLISNKTVIALALEEGIVEIQN
jgi:flagellar basal body P-ring formation protein FlgA